MNENTVGDDGGHLRSLSFSFYKDVHLSVLKDTKLSSKRRHKKNGTRDQVSDL